MKISLLTTLVSAFALQGLAFGASYDTLPKHVNTFVVKQVMASKIESKYNANNKPASLDLKEEFNTSKLQDISNVIKSYFDELKAISPDAYNNFSLGEFSADVNAEVSGQGFGYGFGITDRLTIYGSLPVYHIKTDIKLTQTKPSNLGAIQTTVRNSTSDTAMGKFVRDLTLQLPNTNAELLQSIVVNYYNYEPVGTWEKDALGDAEIGLIYRLTDFDDKGMSIAMGSVLPTGEADNPDSLQDVSTGDGQYDAFAETTMGMGFFNNTLQFDVKGRYTYQFEAQKNVRWIDDPSVPLSQTKRTVTEKLGNKIDYSATVTINPTHWMNFYTSYLVGQSETTKYIDVHDEKVKSALEKDTDTYSRSVKIGMGFSAVEAYRRNLFAMPFEVGVSAQRLMTAKNSYNYDRVDIDLRFYF
jgi:hypothetical protein